MSVAEGGPAAQAGLRQGDIISDIRDGEVDGLADFYRKLWESGSAGAEIPMRVVRDGRETWLRVKSADRGSFLQEAASAVNRRVGAAAAADGVPHFFCTDVETGRHKATSRRRHKREGMPMRLDAIEVVTLFVEDIDDAKAFYQKVFTPEIVYQDDGVGGPEVLGYDDQPAGGHAGARSWSSRRRWRPQVRARASC